MEKTKGLDLSNLYEQTKSCGYHSRLSNLFSLMEEENENNELCNTDFTDFLYDTYGITEFKGAAKLMENIYLTKEDNKTYLFGIRIYFPLEKHLSLEFDWEIYFWDTYYNYAITHG